MSMSDPRLQQHFSRIVAVYLVIGIAVIYTQIITHRLSSFGEGSVIGSHPQIKSGLTAEGLKWAFTPAGEKPWRPLAWISHMAAWSVFGLTEWAHHYSNIALHIANCLLFYFFMIAITGRKGLSAVAAALFAVHPLHVESVAWIGARDKLMGFGLCLCSGFAYVRYLHTARFRFVAAAVAFFLLAFFSDPVMLFLPLSFLAADLTLGKSHEAPNAMRRVGLRRPVAEKAGMMCLAIALYWLSAAPFNFVLYPDIFRRFTDLGRWGHGVEMMGDLLVKTAYPMGLVAHYPSASAMGLFWTLLGPAAVAGLTLAAAARLYKGHMAALGWFWFVSYVLPTAILSPAAWGGLHDHFAYGALAGLAAWAIGEASVLCAHRALLEKACASVALAAIVIFGAVSFRAVPRWESDVALYKYNIEVYPRNARAHEALGIAHQQSGNRRSAIREFIRTLDIEPGRQALRRQLGRLLMREGYYRSASEQFLELVRAEPENASYRYAAARALVSVGEYAQARNHLERALEIAPNDKRIAALYKRFSRPE